MGKVFKKQIKTTEDHGRKQFNASKVLKPEKKSTRSKISWRNFSKRDKKQWNRKWNIDKIKKWEENIKIKDLKYETKK